MSSTKFLCRSEQLVEGEFVELQTEAAGKPLFLVGTRYQGHPRVWMNSCPHQGRPMNWAPNRFLSDDDGRLVCAAHGAVFELDEGRCVSGPCQNAELRSLDLTENDGEVLFAVNT
ncbi:MAG: Rieske (2Fe-2S) protein [Pseudomonadota bacterium]